jgi:hypothetical protein
MFRKDQNDTVSELALNYGSITVRTLRDYYGSFAPHCADDSELGEILADLDVASLTQIIGDYKSGRLEQICQPRSRPKSEIVAKADMVALARAFLDSRIGVSTGRRGAS